MIDTDLLEDSGFFSSKATRWNYYIQFKSIPFIFGPFAKCTLESRIQRTLVSKTPPEECSYTFHITVEVPASYHEPDVQTMCKNSLPFSIFMRSAHHLWKINYYRIASLAVNKDVEFVEVSMYETRSGKSDNEVHEFRVELPWWRDLRYLSSELYVRDKAKKRPI